jgi:hypothetical protein
MHFFNRSPTKSVHKKTLEDAWFGQKPQVYNHKACRLVDVQTSTLCLSSDMVVDESAGLF